AQQEIVALGRHVGSVGDALQGANPTIFNPDWGINASQFLNQIRYPKAEVIQEALDLYQSAFRKPSLTVYCLDYSGSMQGDREEGLKTAMRMILNQEQAKQSFLQAAPDDVTIVIAFSNRVLASWMVKGNSPAELDKLWSQINALRPEG